MSVVVDEGNTNTDTKNFMGYIKLSKVSYFNRGNYGIGYRVNINDPSKSKYSVLSLNNSDNSIKCSQLFVKISPILDDDENDEAHKDIEKTIGMNATPTKDFLNEIRIQTNVYKKSNANLEAICPPIVYSNVLHNSDKCSRAQSLLSIMIKQMPNDENKQILERIKQLYMKHPTMKLGVIAMSFAENYRTLKVVMKDETLSNAQRNIYMNLAVYEMIRLFNIGYMHGDYHTQNIMINTDYKYNNLNDMYSGRCLIIDYGMAFKNKHVDVDNKFTISEKLHLIAQEKQPQTSQNAYTWQSYKWLADFLEAGPEKINRKHEVLSNSISTFQEKMMNKINEKYPGLMNRVHAINASAYRGSVIRGGRAEVSVMESVIEQPMIKTKNSSMIKQSAPQVQTDAWEINNKSDLSNEEFEQIFNPSNMNMSTIIGEYKNTIQEGSIILNDNSVVGGKKKRKTIRKKRKTTRKKRKTTRKKNIKRTKRHYVKK